MTPAKIPITSKERKRLLQSFSELLPSDKEVLNKAIGHLRWLTILWDLEELNPESIPSIPEKRHILLAYKFLQIFWFNKLPEDSSQAFTLYVQDRIPDNQSHEKINEAFDRSADELTLIGDEQQLFLIENREGRHDVRITGELVGDEAFAAAIGDAVLIGRSALAEAV